jgi:hypothetical protein
MQFRPPPVTGVIYNTTMSRPDAALSLALLYGFEGKREARVASIAITENSLGAALFADSVFRFYQLGPIPNANRALPIGLAADKPFPPDSKPVQAVLSRLDERGEPVYKRGIRRVPDTAEVTALMRNSMTYFQDGMVAVILSAPATYLARMMDYPGALDLIKSKVRVLVVSECKQDPVAMRRVLADWPSAVVFCGADIGASLVYPGSAMETDFSWAKAHPVVDFYRNAQAMPYDTPLLDPAAIAYAVHPETGNFKASEAGTIEVLDSSELRWTSAPTGPHKRLVVDPDKRETALAGLRQIISAKPVPPPPRRRFTPEELEKLRLQREEEQRKRELEEKKKLASPPSPITR